MKYTREKKRCPTCDARMVEYSHSLSKLLVSALGKLYRAAGIESLHLKGADLTYSETANFQKLRYWGLAEPTEDAGTWYVTGIGEAFLGGRLSLHSRVITYHGNVRAFEGPKIRVGNVSVPVDERADFLTNEKALGDRDQEWMPL